MSGVKRKHQPKKVKAKATQEVEGKTNCKAVKPKYRRKPKNSKKEIKRVRELAEIKERLQVPHVE
jgi:hypothetical protein